MAHRDKNENIDSIILKKPHVTERATLLTGKNEYTFIVDRGANKVEVKKAVEALYKVKPVKVNIINVPHKKIFGRGKKGIRSGFKKAIVYLREGENTNIL
jgi:large subunit ribosomal protein L23